MSSEASDRDAVRKALVAGLRSERLGVLCKDEPGRYELGGERLSQALMSFFALGDLLFLASGELLAPLLGTIGFFVIVIILAARVSPTVGALAIVLFWLASGAYQLLAIGLAALAATHGLPALVVVAVIAALRIARFVRGVPLLLPVVLVILFAPLLTADLWQLAADLGAHELAYVFCLTILPFLLVLAPQLWRNARSAFLRAAEAVEEDEAALAEAAAALEKAARDDDPDLPERERLLVIIKECFSSEAIEREAPEIQQRISRLLGRRLLFSLVPLTLGLGLCVTLYIYLVAWAMIPIGTVEGWIGAHVTHETLPLLGDVPTGPYLPASVLLGTLATAIFFAFVITDEETYATALTDLLVRKPLRRAALFALPYSTVRREWGEPE